MGVHYKQYEQITESDSINSMGGMIKMMNKEYKRTDSMIDDPSRWDIKKIDRRITIVTDDNRYTEYGRLHIYHIQADCEPAGDEYYEILANLSCFIHVRYGFISNNPIVDVCPNTDVYMGEPMTFIIVLRFFDDDHKKLARYKISDRYPGSECDILNDLYNLEGYIFYSLNAMNYGVLDRSVECRVTAYMKDIERRVPDTEIYKFIHPSYIRPNKQDRKELYNISIKVDGTDCIKTLLMSYDGLHNCIEIIADESILYMLNESLHLHPAVIGKYIY